MASNTNAPQNSNLSLSDPFSDQKQKPLSRQDSWNVDKSPSLESEASNFSSYPPSMRLSRLPPLKSDNEDEDDNESSILSPFSETHRLSLARIHESNTSSSALIDSNQVQNIQLSYIPEIPRRSSKRISLPVSKFESFRTFSRTETSLPVRPGSVSAIVHDIESSDDWGYVYTLIFLFNF